MSGSITLRGYAVPFGQTAYIAADDKLEQFSRGAFTAMLARRPRVELRWDSHEDDAPRMATCVEMFQDDYGLGFSATVALSANWSRIAAMVQRTNPSSFCSVGGLKITASHRGATDVGQAEIVTNASIDHITICGNAAYRGTGAWPADRALDFAPLRIQQLSDQWDRGVIAARRATTLSATINRSAQKLIAGVGVSAAGAAGLASMFERRRSEMMAKRAARSGWPTDGSLLVGHIAFSKAADILFGDE